MPSIRWLEHPTTPGEYHPCDRAHPTDELHVEFSAGIVPIWCTAVASVRRAADNDVVMTTKTPNLTLNNGVSVPQLGFGTSSLAGSTGQEALEYALNVGYRHIDTAAAYRNEDIVGSAIRASGFPPDDVFITTKVRNGEHGYETTLRAFDASARSLGVDVVDMYLVHWPVPSQDKFVETWRALEKLYQDGAVRAIGVANFLPNHLKRLLGETDVVPAVNQIEVHPSFQQHQVQEVSRDAGLAVTAYSPLGKGADIESEVLAEVADRHGVTPGQVVLAWHIVQGRIVIPKSVNSARIRANFDVTSFELTDVDLAAIDALEANNRVCFDPATFDSDQMG